MKKTICSMAILVTICLSSPAENLPIKRHNARPTCITCGWQGDCRSCTIGGTSQFCRTPDCATCIDSGSCNPHGGFEESSTGNGIESGAVKDNQNLTFRISARIIQEIGQKHPRFAATLANLNMFGFTAGEHRVHWTPVDITSKDVAAFLNREGNKNFFKKYNQKARKLNTQIQKGEIEEIVYLVTVKQQDQNWTIKLTVEGSPAITMSDPAFSTLEVTLESGGIGVEVDKPLKGRWQIN